MALSLSLVCRYQRSINTTLWSGNSLPRRHSRRLQACHLPDSLLPTLPTSLPASLCPSAVPHTGRHQPATPSSRGPQEGGHEGYARELSCRCPARGTCVLMSSLRRAEGMNERWSVCCRRGTGNTLVEYPRAMLREHGVGVRSRGHRAFHTVVSTVWLGSNNAPPCDQERGMSKAMRAREVVCACEALRTVM